MALHYRHPLKPKNVEPAIHMIRLYLQQNAYPIPYLTREDLEEFTDAWLVPLDLEEEIQRNIPLSRATWVSKASGLLVSFPWGAEPLTFVYAFRKNMENPSSTVTPDFIRLPKLSHLITLTPEDFFTFLSIIATASLSSNKTALTLKTTIDINTSIFSPFFKKMITNYRISPEYADKKWTPFKAVNFLAALSPTIENQLNAMQFLSAIQNDDLMCFPISAAINLQLDQIEELDESYAIPPTVDDLLMP